jgi:hypothetical protein
MRSLLLLVGLLAGFALPHDAAAQNVVGSPTIDRPLDDVSSGVIYVYRGGTQPLVGPGRIERWAFHDKEFASSASKVTPLVLERTGATSWKVVGIGRTRVSNGSGVQTFAFETIAGTNDLTPGTSYTIGFTHRGYTGTGANVVADGGNGGVVDFSGYGITTDLWSYAFGTAQIGTVLGSGGLVLDSNGSGGRIYSMQAVSAGVVTIAGCGANPAFLLLDVPTLRPGSSGDARVGSPNFTEGFHQLWYGVPSITPLGCGLALPGLGEVFLVPGTQVLLSSGFYAGGNSNTTITVPSVPALVGVHVVLQGVAVGVFTTGAPIELTNGLSVVIAP